MVSPHYIRESNSPSLGDKYAYFRRMNIGTVILATIHTLLMALIVLLDNLPQLDTLAEPTRTLIGRLIPVCVGVCIVLYDLFYASAKIISRDLKNYGIDFIFFGILAAIFGYLVGIYIAIKGLYVMIIALTDRLVFAWRYEKTFRQVFLEFMNKFTVGLGFIVLLLKNPYFVLEPPPLTYFYVAVGALLIDAVFLRWLVNRSAFFQVPLWVGVVKMAFGVAACYYYLAGIMLVFEGFLIVLVAVFRYQPEPGLRQ